MIGGQQEEKRKCDMSLIWEWVFINKQTIINGFLKCYLGNALDGSQDDKIWKDDCMNQSDDTCMDVE